MAALDFPASSASPWTAPNGVIYTWNADGYWEAKADPNDFDADYLKLDASNDPVTGNLALAQDLAVAGTSDFTGLTTHEDGVSVTGGDLVVDAGSIRQGTLTAAAAAGSGVFINGFVRQYCNQTDFPEGDRNDEQPFQVISAPNDASTKEVVLSLNASGSAYFKGNVGVGTDSPDNTVHIKNTRIARLKIETSASDASADCAYFSSAGLAGVVGYSHLTDAMAIDSRTPSGDIIFSRSGSQRIRFDKFGGIHNTVNDPSSFGIKCAGSAPNYFSGQLFCSPNSLNVNFWNQFDRGFIKAYAGNNAIVSTGDKSYAPIQVSVGADFSTTKFLFSAQSGAGNGGSLVTASGGDLAFNNTSDYRVKTNIQTYSQNASNKINALRLVSYTRTDFNVDVPIGFIAHELQEQIPEAVFGEKDKEVAIGTLADYDGTELETDVVEPDDLTYTEDITDSEGVTTQAVRTRSWTPTGTRPVYQGVDQIKLIPLLTKALQEALERIEVLEAAAGGGTKVTTRKKR